MDEEVKEEIDFERKEGKKIVIVKEDKENERKIIDKDEKEKGLRKELKKEDGEIMGVKYGN